MEVYEPAYTYLLDGVDVREWTYLFDNLTHSELSVRSQQLEIPGRSGNLHVPSKWTVLDAPVLELVLAPAAQSAGELEESLNRLQAILLDPNLRVVRCRPFGDESRPQLTVTRGELVNAKATKEDAMAGRWGRWNLKIRLPEVAWRDLKPKIVHVLPGENVRVNGFAGTLPVDDLRIHVRGPLTSIGVTDLVTSTGVTWVGSLGDKEILTIDMGMLSASVTADEGEVRSVTGGLDYPTSGRLVLGLDPKTRKQRVCLTLTGNEVGKTDVSLEGRRAWM